jgi:hypothetical protein
MAERLLRSCEDEQRFNRQLARMQQVWEAFWQPFGKRAAQSR